jgi:hypothetical protein
VGEWVPAGDDGRKWRWLSAAVTMGRREDASCRWGEEMGLGKKKGERKGFSTAVTAGRGFGEGITGCWWMENLGAGGGRMGVEGEWVWGETFGGGNEIVRAFFSFFFFFLKKRKPKDR